jgi:large subunit ribosomal protein L29
MSAKDYHEKSVEALNDELTALRKAQFGLRMQLATQQLSNTSEIKKVRRNIARVKTILAKKAKA